MNDLGWSLGWLAVQVAVVLGPAMAWHALARRRGPASGAWVASLSLGMVVVLAASWLVPRGGREASRPWVEVSASRDLAPGADPVPGGPKVEEPARGSTARPPLFEGFRLAWGRFERGATAPVERFRPWGRALAWVWLAGAGLGLGRLLIGLGAVSLCRVRGALVADPALLAMVAELRGAMGCSRPIEVREVADLTTPATAGWLRPMLLLPSGWRGWDESERRAVVAYELAHVVRGDYASGLVARAAVVLNPGHPMVRWMAGRLHLEQELAADSLGARFAGGASSYLLALSRLALEQDGRPSSWPARAFLPARGTLIRRIAMLKDVNRTAVAEQPSLVFARRATTLGLLALTLGVASWKAPAGAADTPPSPALPAAAKAEASEAAKPFEVRYLPDNAVGVYGFRPAATLRRSGFDSLTPTIRKKVDEVRAYLAGRSQVDPSRPGFIPIRIEDIESVTTGFNMERSKPMTAPAAAPPQHTLGTSGLTLRMVAPFDWLGFFRQWNMKVEELKEPRGVYYQMQGPFLLDPKVTLSFFLPDDRTLVVESESRVKELIAREVPSSPAFLRGADWDKVSRDLYAVAINNQDDAFVKGYDLGRPDDAMVVGCFKGVDRWVVGLADAASLTPRGEATARNPEAAERLEGALAILLNMGRAAIKASPEEPKELETPAKMAKGLLSSMQIHREGSGVAVSAGEFGTVAELARLCEAMVRSEDRARIDLKQKNPLREAKRFEAKAPAKLEVR